jgi:hypothetical protein
MGAAAIHKPNVPSLTRIWSDSRQKEAPVGTGESPAGSLVTILTELLLLLVIPVQELKMQILSSLV